MSPVAACRLLIILPLFCSIMHGMAVKPVWGESGIVDAIVARVNGEAVLYSHLRRDMQMEKLVPGYSFEGPLRSEHYRTQIYLQNHVQFHLQKNDIIIRDIFYLSYNQKGKSYMPVNASLLVCILLLS